MTQSNIINGYVETKTAIRCYLINDPNGLVLWSWLVQGELTDFRMISARTSVRNMFQRAEPARRLEGRNSAIKILPLSGS